jgi:hypothetical protein
MNSVHHFPQHDAETVTEAFVLNIVLKFAVPAKILTDQGSDFLSSFFKNMCKLLRIRKMQTTASHPESNVGLERSHRVVAEYLQHYMCKDQDNWDEFVPYAFYMYNTTTYTVTECTPFILVYGFKSAMPSALRDSPSIQYSYKDYLTELKGRLQTAHEVARQKVILWKGRSKELCENGDRII